MGGIASVPEPDDDLVVLASEGSEGSAPGLPAWRVLIVDDDQDVHDATRLALRTVRFRDRPIEFLSAYSAAEACRLLDLHDDIAVIFLDVVMESDDAGLRAIRKIRGSGHELVRIVLRTGHPGYAPQQQVVVDYDIHAYLEKSSLDFHRLFSALISALRAYSDILRVEQHRRGVATVLEAVSWFDLRSLRRYLARMLAELPSLAGIELEDLVLAVRSSRPLDDALQPSPGTPFVSLVDCIAGAPLTPQENAFIAAAFESGQGSSTDLGAGFYTTVSGIELVLFSRNRRMLEIADLALLELFLNKVAQALDNHATFSTILQERDKLVRNFVTLGERWGGHDEDEIKRIQALSHDTAELLQQRLVFPDEIDDWFVFSVATACGFHDVGLAELSHRLFEQAAPLSPEDRRVLQEHVETGIALLRKRMSGLLDSRLYAMSETIIRQHHERHDGSGYPRGISGSQIALPARIAGIVDCYVAMISPRPWRPAHPRETALEHIRTQRGILFDPDVTDAFLDAVDAAAH